MRKLASDAGIILGEGGGWQGKVLNTDMTLSFDLMADNESWSIHSLTTIVHKTFNMLTL